MSRIAKLINVVIVIAVCMCTTAARADTAFTYQGELKQNGNLASGTFDMEFSLWNTASGGSQAGETIQVNGVQVVEGRFTVELDYGADAFSGPSRFLEIAVEGFTLSPRKQLTASPFAVRTHGIFVDDDQNVGIGTVNPTRKLHIEANGTTGLYVDNNGANAGSKFGWRGWNPSSRTQNQSENHPEKH